MKVKTRILSFSMALLLLAGCGNDPIAASHETEASSQAFGTTTASVYQAEVMDTYQKAPLVERSDIQKLFLDGDTIYFSTETEIYRLEQDVESLVCSAYVPITCFAVSGEDVWYVSGASTNSEDGYQEDYCLIHHSSSGETAYTLGSLDAYNGGGATDILLSSSGEIYLQLADAIAVLDLQGNFLRRITAETEQALDHLLESNTGEIYGSSLFGGNEIFSVSSDGITQYLSLSYTDFPNGIPCPAGDDADFYLVNTNGLYRCNDGTVTQTAKWSDSGISFLNIEELYPTSSGSFVLLDSGTLYELSPANEDQVTPSQVIEIAVDMMQSTLSEAVARFNASNSAYHVELVQYFNGNDGYEEGMDRLKLELASGEGPDILGISCYSMDLSTISAYGSNGYLVDLNTYLSQDEETRSDLAILSALESDGKLYYVTDGYFIQTALGLTSQWGETTGWTFQRYEEILDSNGTVFRYMSPEMFLSISFFALEHQFIDFETGECKFDSEEFIDLLKLAAKHENTLSLRTEDDEAGIPDEAYFLPDGRAVASRTDLRSIAEFATLENKLGQELSIIGWPNLDGSCGSTIRPNHLFAINANSENKDGAWEFLKFLMTDPQVQNMVATERGFPVSQKALERSASMGAEIDCDTATTAQAEKVIDLISQISSVYSEDSIYNIVNEEAEAFFAGDKTAEETAKIIGNRVQIYLSEQS